MYRDFNIKTDFKRIVHYDHWISPIHLPKRFDTHFFLAITSDFDVDVDLLSTDDKEVTRFEWWTPTEALKRFYNGEIVLFPPQFYIINEMLTLGNLQKIQIFSRNKKVRPNLPIFKSIPGSESKTKSMFLLPEDHQYPQELYRSSSSSAIHRVIVEIDPKTKTMIHYELLSNLNEYSEHRL
jgi:nucleoside diphosphate-linked moiety X motif protein 19